MRILLLLILILSGAMLQSQSLIIKNVYIVDAVNGDISDLQSIRISDGVISEIGISVASSNAVETIDGDGRYLMPGMIDAHIHLFQSGGLYTRPDAIDLTHIRPYQEERQWLRDNAGDILHSYLRVGVTSVVDVGGPMYQYQERIKLAEDVTVPTLYMTGPLISTYLPPELDVVDPPIVKVVTTEEARELVRKQAPLKPDFIKIWYIALPTQSAETTYDIVAATINEANKYNLPVAVHATQLNTAKLAIKAGASILVHSVSDLIDDDFVDMLIDSGVVYVPTLTVHGNYNLAFAGQLEFQKEDFDIVNPEVLGGLLDIYHIQDDYLDQVKRYADQYLKSDTDADKIRYANLARLSKTDAIIATGTDAGNIGTLHASSYIEELKAMKAAGMTDAAIIKASTYGAAQATGIKSNDRGQVKKGKIADLLLVDSNPLMDAVTATKPSLIIKNGSVITLADNPYDSPAELAQAQLNAYNSQDIEAFLVPYAEDVEVYQYPDNLVYQGKGEMRARYGNFFNNTPDLHCKLVDRKVEGNIVTDSEYVTGLSDGRVIEAIAIYHIEDGKIARVYFK